MKNKLPVILAVVLLGGPVAANAVPTLSLDDGVNSITVEDQGAGDVNPIAGIVTVVWTAPDTLWTSTVSVGTTYPAQGSASAPFLDLNAVVTSPRAGSLTISFTQDGFLPTSGIYSSGVGGTLNLDSSAGFSATAGGQGISAIGPFSTAGAFSGTDSSPFSSGISPYSITLQAVITHGRSGTSSFDYQVEHAAAVPEPATLALFGLGLAALGFARRRK